MQSRLYFAVAIGDGNEEKAEAISKLTRTETMAIYIVRDYMTRHDTALPSRDVKNHGVTEQLSRQMKSMQ